MSSISIKNLTKRFGSTVAVDDLSLEIEDHEFLVMVGPTGAGKTTSLRCIAGLEKPDAGEILFNGEDMTGASPASRNVAFVFQNYALYPRKSAFENIAFPLRARNYSEEERKREVQRVAEMLRISHLLDKRPGQLSGGEQQRVALGRAMVRSPHVYLMDEPLTNLDFLLRGEMRIELKRIQQEMNRTFFYVTNDQIEALSMGDRIAVLNQGVLQQVGPPQEIYEKPANLFVATFIGSIRMNLLHCTYNADAGLLQGHDGNWQVNATNGLREAAQNSQDTSKLIMGIRPEDIGLSLEVGERDLSGTVYVVEPLGDRNIYDIQLGKNLLKVKAPASFVVDTGTPVSIRFDLNRLHLFDATTEKVLT